MGCDIHGLCEVKVNGKWRVNTDNVFRNPYFLSDEALVERQKDRPDYERSDFQKEEFHSHPDDGRNYDWFAILADVRNGRGFAGIPTGDGFAVIAEPRGVPEDCSKEWKGEVKQWGGDIHSTSYLTVEDFDAFDWGLTTMKSGIIPLDEYQTLNPTGASPESWSGMITGPDIVVVDMESADLILKGDMVVVEPYDPMVSLRRGDKKSVMVSLESGHNVHVNYFWKVKYSEWFDHKIKNIIEPMRELKKKYEDVRYVFGFDN